MPLTQSPRTCQNTHPWATPTEFEGSVSISPPLNAHEIAYLRKFAASRRMDRARGPYFVDGSGPFGQGHDDDIRDFNKPPAGQPGLWCRWEPTKDGTAIKWNGVEGEDDDDRWRLIVTGNTVRFHAGGLVLRTRSAAAAQ